MASLQELRQQLDEVDSRIGELYEKRMSICEQVGEYKIQAGAKVLDRMREKEKLQDVAGMASSPFNKKGIQELYEQLMSMSRKLQYQKLVEAGDGFSGLPGRQNCVSGDRGSLWAGSHEDIFRRKC